MSRVLLAIALGGLLIAAGVFAYLGLFESHDTPLGVHGWVAMALGAVLSLAVGIGLMTLMFYSSRHGYDELPRADTDRDQR